MLQFAHITFWVLVGVGAGQYVFVVPLLVKLWRAGRRPERTPDELCPPAAVVLCVRGRDPFLPRCLEAILAQDYPQYELVVVLDREDDPGRPQVEAALAAAPPGRARIEVLRDPAETCSLKCCALTQAIESLEETIEIVAGVDGDVIVPTTWLRELAGGLAKPGVGAATGNRWYRPAQANCGSMVRALWNAATIIHMSLYRVPWGGTLAVRRSTIREAGLIERWRQTFCEDTPLTRALKPLKQRVQFVPSLMMINEESCTVGEAAGWISRQLLTARLYHPSFPSAVLHGAMTTGPLAAAAVGLVAALVSGQWTAAAWLAGGLVFYQTVLVIGMVLLEICIEPMAQRRGAPRGNLSLGRILWQYACLPVTQLVHPYAMLRAIFTRHATWRGIDYKIGPGSQVQMLGYEPYGQAEDAAQMERSL